MKKRFSDLNVQSIFFLSSLGLLTAVFFVILLFPHVSQEFLVIGNKSFLHDFLEPVGWSCHWDDFYVQRPGPNYPPLACLMFALAGKMAEMLSGSSLNQLLDYNIYIITLYFIQIGLCILGLYGVIQREAKEIRFPGILVMLIFLSYPSICYAIPVGNSIFFVVVLLCAANLWKNSESPVYRELALIFIAAAAAFKIYPAIFAFFYWKEKRGKELLRLFIYGCMFFWLPFLFLGKAEGVKWFFLNLQTFQEAGASGSYTTISGIVEKFVGGENGFSQLVSVSYCLAALLFAYRTKVKWKEEFLVCSLMVIAFSGKNMYSLLYFVVPLLTFLNAPNRSCGKWDKWYALGFSLIFTILPAEHNTAYKYLLLYTMTAVLLVDIGIQNFKKQSAS